MWGTMCEEADFPRGKGRVVQQKLNRKKGNEAGQKEPRKDLGGEERQKRQRESLLFARGTEVKLNTRESTKATEWKRP